MNEGQRLIPFHTLKGLQSHTDIHMQWSLFFILLQAPLNCAVKTFRCLKTRFTEHKSNALMPDAYIVPFSGGSQSPFQTLIIYTTVR